MQVSVPGFQLGVGYADPRSFSSIAPVFGNQTAYMHAYLGNLNAPYIANSGHALEGMPYTPFNPKNPFDLSLSLRSKTPSSPASIATISEVRGETLHASYNAQYIDAHLWSTQVLQVSPPI